jgi:IPT/TIG domain
VESCEQAIFVVVDVKNCLFLGAVRIFPRLHFHPQTFEVICTTVELCQRTFTISLQARDIEVFSAESNEHAQQIFPVSAGSSGGDKSGQRRAGTDEIGSRKIEGEPVNMISRTKQCLTVLLTLVCGLALGASAVAQQSVVVSRPVLTSLHPSAASAKAGSASLIIVASGQNFVHGVTTVQIQGTPRQTTVVNSEALAFELTAADLATPQTLMVNVVNQTGSQSFKSNSLPFVVLP